MFNIVAAAIFAAQLLAAALLGGCTTAPAPTTDQIGVRPCLQWESATVPLPGATLTTHRCTLRG